MKKTFALTLVFLLVLTLLAGCGAPAGDSTPPASTPASAPADAGSEAAGEDTPETGDDQLRVVMVIPQKLGDSGPMDGLKTSLDQAASEYNLDTAIYEALEPSQHEEVVRTYAREDVDMIICAMPTMVEALKAVAPEFPDVKFCMVFPLEDIVMDNVVCVDFATWEGYYLCGILAGHMSQVGKTGHVIGAEQSALIANYNAFAAGGKSINPDFEVLLSNANSFDDPAKGKEAGLSLVDQGCDLIITDCAATAMGTIEACEERGIFAIGDSSPHYEISPATVLADTMTQFGPAMYSQVKAFAEGNFEAGTHFSTLAEGGIGIYLSPVIAENLSDDDKARYEAAEADIEAASAKIISGELTVERNINK